MNSSFDSSRKRSELAEFVAEIRCRLDSIRRRISAASEPAQGGPRDSVDHEAASTVDNEEDGA